MRTEKPTDCLVIRSLVKLKIFCRKYIRHKTEPASIMIEKFKVRIMVFRTGIQIAVKVNVSVDCHVFNLQLSTIEILKGTA